MQPVLAWIAGHAEPSSAGRSRRRLPPWSRFWRRSTCSRRRPLKRRIIELSPLSDGYDEAIFERLSDAMRSVLRGSLSIAVIQVS